MPAIVKLTVGGAAAPGASTSETRTTTMKRFIVRAGAARRRARLRRRRNEQERQASRTRADLGSKLLDGRRALRVAQGRGRAGRLKPARWLRFATAAALDRLRLHDNLWLRGRRLRRLRTHDRSCPLDDRRGCDGRRSAAHRCRLGSGSPGAARARRLPAADRATASPPPQTRRGRRPAGERLRSERLCAAATTILPVVPSSPRFPGFSRSYCGFSGVSTRRTAPQAGPEPAYGATPGV